MLKQHIIPLLEDRYGEGYYPLSEIFDDNDHIYGSYIHTKTKDLHIFVSSIPEYNTLNITEVLGPYACTIPPIKYFLVEDKTTINSLVKNISSIYPDAVYEEIVNEICIAVDELREHLIYPTLIALKWIVRKAFKKQYYSSNIPKVTSNYTTDEEDGTTLIVDTLPDPITPETELQKEFDFLVVEELHDAFGRDFELLIEALVNKTMDGYHRRTLSKIRKYCREHDIIKGDIL